ILSSHILSEVQNTCDHIIIIDKGAVVQQGSYEELVTMAQAGRVYRIKVAREAARLAQALVAFQGIMAPKAVSDDEVEFALGKGDGEKVIDDIARKVIDGGHGLRELA